jgi:hypothetical protein
MSAPIYTLVINASASVAWSDTPVKDDDDRDLRHWVHRSLNEISARHRASMEAEAKHFMKLAESCWP